MSAHDHQSLHARRGSFSSLRARRTFSLLAVLPQQSARAEAARGILLVIIVLLREAGGL